MISLKIHLLMIIIIIIFSPFFPLNRNWKTQSSSTWSYQAGLAQGWIPQKPTTRVFKASKNCPTAVLSTKVTFATTSNSTTTTNTSAKKRSANSLSDSAPQNNPLVLYNSTGNIAGALSNIIPAITNISQTVIDSNVYPFVGKTTFGQGVWH